MRISEQKAFFIGGNRENIEAEENKKSSGVIAAGTLNEDLFAGKLQQKKKEAQEKAMKVVENAWAGDRMIDEDIQTRRDKIAALKSENEGLMKEINGIKEEQKALMETYGITADSKEQKDLELLRRREQWRKGENVDFTKEDLEYTNKLKAEGLSDYVSRQLDYDSQIAHFQKNIDENEDMILQENAIIRGVKLERLKSHTMVDAAKEAENIMDVASKEILAAAMEEGREYIDELSKEKEEKAEKLEEELEEQQEFVEKQQEKNREAEELIENMPMEEMLQLDKLQTEVEQEVKKIISDMKLVAEDIKGAMVDESL